MLHWSPASSSAYSLSLLLLEVYYPLMMVLSVSQSSDLISAFFFIVFLHEEHEHAYCTGVCIFQARVQRVHVDGLARTKDDIVISTVRDVFSAQDFQNVSTVASHTIYDLYSPFQPFPGVYVFFLYSNFPLVKSV